jgi:hypothetical protein
MMWGYDKEDWSYGFGLDGWWNKGVVGGKKYSSTTYVAGTYIKTLVEKDKLIKNAIKWIRKSIDNNIIFIEPQVRIKFMHMMAIAGGEEIFSKLIVQPEHGWLVVKDCVIPYQVVSGAHFKADEDSLNKWTYELQFEDNDPMKDETGKAQGVVRTPEQVSGLTERMKGHFHSHNSINNSTKPTPSITDTDDMYRNLEGQPYWLEIIGVMGSDNVGIFSGRMVTSEPRSIVDVEIKEKWWKGIDKTITEAEGKIFLSKWQSSYSNNKTKNDKNENKNKTKYDDFPIKKCPSYDPQVCEHDNCCIICEHRDDCRARCPHTEETCMYIINALAEERAQKEITKDQQDEIKKLYELTDNELLDLCEDSDGMIPINSGNGVFTKYKRAVLTKTEKDIAINTMRRNMHNKILKDLGLMEKKKLTILMTTDTIPIDNNMINPKYCEGDIWISKINEDVIWFILITI